MNRARSRVVQLASTVALLVLGVAGCKRQDADRLAQAGGQAAQKVEKLVVGSRPRIVHGWQTWPLHLVEVAVDTRVAARLNWDRGLMETQIQVQMVDGAVELQGQVRSQEQKRRAVAIAETTLGVEQVRDRLEVRP